MNKNKCICGSEQIVELFSLKKEDKKILRCKKCTLAWISPSPDVDYKDYDFSDYIKYKKAHQSRDKQILDLLLLYKNKGKLLEFGCGVGFFLELAKAKGFIVKGIDISDVAVQHAKNLVGDDNVEKADVVDLVFNNQIYDCVVINNFLEHIQDPLQLLIKTKTILKGDGALIICSPNIDGLYVKFIKEDAYILRPNEHIWQFSVSAIESLLEQAGYAPIRIKKIGFINEQLFLHNLRFFRINKTSIKNLFLNSLNYILGKLGFGDMFIAVAKKA